MSMTCNNFNRVKNKFNILEEKEENVRELQLEVHNLKGIIKNLH